MGGTILLCLFKDLHSGGLSDTSASDPASKWLSSEEGESSTVSLEDLLELHFLRNSVPQLIRTSLVWPCPTELLFGLLSNIFLQIASYFYKPKSANDTFLCLGMGPF